LFLLIYLVSYLYFSYTWGKNTISFGNKAFNWNMSWNIVFMWKKEVLIILSKKQFDLFIRKGIIKKFLIYDFSYFFFRKNWRKIYFLILTLTYTILVTQKASILKYKYL